MQLAHLCWVICTSGPLGLPSFLFLPLHCHHNPQPSSSFSTPWYSGSSLCMVLLAFIAALLCLLPSAGGSGALGDWGIGGPNKSCFCPFSCLLSVTLQQCWSPCAASTHNPKRADQFVLCFEPHPGWWCASSLGNDLACCLFQGSEISNENIPWEMI